MTNLEGIEALLGALRLSDGGRAAVLEARYLAVVCLSCSTAKLVEVTCAALSQARNFVRNAVIASCASLCVHSHQLLLVRVSLSLCLAQLRICVRSFRRFALDSSTRVLECRGESCTLCCKKFDPLRAALGLGNSGIAIETCSVKCGLLHGDDLRFSLMKKLRSAKGHDSR